MEDATWKVKAYIEYEIEAQSEGEAIERLVQCMLTDLNENGNIRDIAEISAEKIRDTGIED
jgi:hypothetical protein